MRKTVTAAAMAASLTIGGAAGAALFVPSISGAQEDTTTTTPADETTESTDEARHDKGERLGEILAPLVDDGTITQAQADAVIETLQEARADRPGRGDRFPGGQALLEVLSLTGEELRTALADGQTLAEIAETQGVSVDDVVAAVVAALDERLTTAVENGRITEDEKATKLAEATEKITAVMNGEADLGDFEGRRGRRGHGPRGDAAPGADESTTDSGDDTVGS